MVTYNEPSSGINAGALIAILVVSLAVTVFFIVAMWRVYTKAGQPGWAAIVPFYNIYVLCKIAGRPGWWLIWYFIPIANIVVSIIVSIDVAKSFDKDATFGVILLWLLAIIGYPILAFGQAEYVGPAADPDRQS